MCECDIKKVMGNRKPWYQRAMAIARFTTNWRTIPKSQPQQEITRPLRNPSINNKSSNQIHHQLRKCTSLKLAANSLTRICLCAPIGPCDDVFRNYVPPRRSSSYPPSKMVPMVTETTARVSVDSGRRIFRGKSLNGGGRRSDDGDKKERSNGDSEEEISNEEEEEAWTKSS